MSWLFKFCCGQEPPNQTKKQQQIIQKPQNKKDLNIPVQNIKEAPIQPASALLTPTKLKKTKSKRTDRYQGQELNGVPHGYGSILYANGDFYRGEWVNGIKQGQGLQIYQQQKMQYKGQWKNDQPHGQGILTQANESYYMGQFKTGKKHGKGTYYDSTTKKQYSRVYYLDELIDQKEVSAIIPSKDQQFPTLVLDKQRFDSHDISCFENQNPSFDNVQLVQLLKYYGLSDLTRVQFIIKDVNEWNIKQVLQFLDYTQLASYKKVFYKNKIKGKDMITLREQELREDLNMKMGDRKRLLNHILFLRELSLKRSSIIRKNSQKTKDNNNYKLRSNRQLKKALINVKNYPVYQISIEERSSQSSGNSQKYTTNKIKIQAAVSDQRQYDSEALQKKYSVGRTNSLRKSSFQELIEPKSQQSQEYIFPKKQYINHTSKIIKNENFQSLQENVKSSMSQQNHNRKSKQIRHNFDVKTPSNLKKQPNNLLKPQYLQPFHHQHNNNDNKDAIQGKSGSHKTPYQSHSEGHHRKSIDNNNKSGSSSSSEDVQQLQLHRKRTHDKTSLHNFSQIRQLYEFLKQHQSLDFLIKERDIQKLQLIGEGGFGKVYRGKYIGAQIAIKDYLKKSHRHKQDFKKELTIISDLKHPNIVLYMGMCITTEKYILITEFMKNGSLFDQIHKKQAIFDQAKQLDIAFEIVKGMVYLHNMKKILHRDLKSSNVLIGEDWQVKLCDFGLSSQKKKIKKMSGRVGTLQWMAPEVLRNQDNIDQYSDVYSFGVIIWQILSRKIPYAGLNEQMIVKLVGNDDQHMLEYPQGNEFLLNIMEKCLKRKAHQRPTFMEIQSYFEVQFAAQRQRNF